MVWEGNDRQKCISRGQKLLAKLMPGELPTPGRLDLRPKWIRLATEPKCTEICSEKVPDLSHFRPNAAFLVRAHCIISRLCLYSDNMSASAPLTAVWSLHLPISVSSGKWGGEMVVCTQISQGLQFTHINNVIVILGGQSRPESQSVILALNGTKSGTFIIRFPY